MKKNRTKRLNLSRETLAKLEDERLQAIDGGATTRGVCCTASNSCPPPPSAVEC